MFKINPIYKKELKISVRGIKLPALLAGYNALLILISLVAFYFIFDSHYGGSAIEYVGILWLYAGIAVLEFALIMFVVPAFTSSAISGERERQTLDILLSSRLLPGSIIRGKLLASISSILLLILSGLPVLSLVFAVGGIRLSDLIGLLLFYMVTAFFVGSIGIYYSTVFKKTVPATVATYGTILLLCLATYGIVWISNVIAVKAYDMNYYAAGTDMAYQPPGLGYELLILVVNPLFSLAALLSKQFGDTAYLKNLLSSYGTLPDFWYAYWFPISLVVQVAISVFLLCRCTKRLRPH